MQELSQQHVCFKKNCCDWETYCKMSSNPILLVKLEPTEAILVFFFFIKRNEKSARCHVSAAKQRHICKHSTKHSELYLFRFCWAMTSVYQSLVVSCFCRLSGPSNWRIIYYELDKLESVCSGDGNVLVVTYTWIIHHFHINLSLFSEKFRYILIKQAIFS